MTSLVEASLNGRGSQVSTVDITQIRKDIPRTFCEESNVANYADVIERVLVEYAAHDPDVGYCQGMNCVAAVVAVQFPDPPVAFSHFGTLVCGIRGLWLPQFPLLFGGAVAFDSLYKTQLPTLHRHFAAKSMSTDMFLPDAWLALFSRWCPFGLLWRMFELIELEGFPGVLSLTAALLEAHSAALVETEDFTSLFVLLKALGKQPRQPDVQDVLAAARRLLPAARNSLQHSEDENSEHTTEEHGPVQRENTTSTHHTCRREGSRVMHEVSGLELMHDGHTHEWLQIARRIAARLPRGHTDASSSGNIGIDMPNTPSSCSVMSPEQNGNKKGLCCRRPRRRAARPKDSSPIQPDSAPTRIVERL